METEKVIFPWDEFFFVANGVDINQIPLSIGTLSIDEEKTPGEEYLNVATEYLEEAAFDIKASGGCAVITADMERKKMPIIERIHNLCTKWLEDVEKNSPEIEKQYLTLTIIPFALNGKIIMIYNQLVFFDYYEFDDTIRLIFGFDNTQTTPMVTDEVDFEKYLKEAELEVKAELEEIQAEIDEAEAIIEESKKYNPYEERIKERMNLITPKNLSDEEEVTNSGLRAVKEDDTSNGN